MIELGSRPETPASRFGIERANQLFRHHRVHGNRTPRSLALRIVDIPPLGDEAEKPPRYSELGFNG